MVTTIHGTTNLRSVAQAREREAYCELVVFWGKHQASDSLKVMIGGESSAIS